MRVFISSFFFVFLLISLTQPILAEPSPPPVYEIKQGEVGFLTVFFDQKASRLEGRFLGKKIFFDRISGSRNFGTLLGIDLDQGTSDQNVTDFQSGEILATIHILPNQFGRQEIQVPGQFVNPSRRQMDRIKRDKEEIHTILSFFSGKRRWQGNFIMPVSGTPKSTFGLRRIFNGEPRNPHTGEDIAAPEKTPVYATNDGVVAGVVNHFFSGNGIIIDHGQGLFTEYFHLYKSEVKKGQKLKKGEEIGLVGKTGRATGPHLHWGMMINGARVNPLSVVHLKLE
ncbi:MAG: M23 family metallopeptidase [Nitrospirae bacterium]|nr:M23 family metallopeptidase [Nitrospirota bacterium]MBI3352967.1 M23 family metallopeptidase [Nitrospirota bacterium]